MPCVFSFFSVIAVITLSVSLYNIFCVGLCVEFQLFSNYENSGLAGD